MLDVSAKQGIFKRIRLVIVDRQPIVLQGLKSVLGAQQDFDVVASCGDGTSCLAAIRNLIPDIALISDTLPDLTVSSILAIAKAETPSTRLVFFTESESDRDLTAAVAAGACSVISKYASPDTMLRLLRLSTTRSVAPEQFDLSPTGKEADDGGKIEKMLELLTHRELQIVRLVSEGMSNKEIARQLNVSPGTVKVHLYNIFQKLEITNRTVLATLALLQRPSGFGTLALALLAIAIADELKASEANDMLPNGESIGPAGEHAEYEPWKKAILRHLIVWESTETPPLTQRGFFAKLGQVTNPAAAMETLRAAEQSAGSKPWKDDSPAGSSTPNLAALLPRGTNDTQIGGDPTLEHQIPRLTSNPMSLHGGYGTFATLAGALIYALHDPHLVVQSHDPGKAPIDSFLAASEENAATKVAAITNADANHVDSSILGFLAHDSRLPSASVTTENESVAGEGVRSQMSHLAAGDSLQKAVALLGFGHDAGIGGYSRDQLLGGSLDENGVHRSAIDSNSTSSSSVFDFVSGPGRINLAAFGALAWMHMTAASKSIPPHTLAWIYNSASNETIVYVNPTDHVLDVGDRGLVEIHLQGNVSMAESDFVHQPEGAAVAATLEALEKALIPAVATDETVLSADHLRGTAGASEGTLGTDGVWYRLADDGVRFQFGQTRAGSEVSTRFRTFTRDSADAAKESDGASGMSVHVSSIEPAHSAAAKAIENLTLKNESSIAGTGVSSSEPNEIVQSSDATADGAGRGNSEHAWKPGSAKAAVAELTETGSGVGNGAEHHSPAANGSRGAAKAAEPSGVEHSNSGHAASANAPNAAESVEPSVATADGADRGNSEHAWEPGSAKAAAAELPETGNGVGNGAEHHSPAAEDSRGAAKTAEPSDVEHSNSGHAASANAPNAAASVEPSVATAEGAGRGNSEHAWEPRSAKAAAAELTETGNGADHHSPAADGSRGAAKTAEPSGVEHSNSGHAASANAPDATESAEPSVATADGAGHGNSEHAWEPRSAKAAAAELTETGNGVGNGAEHHSSAADGSPGAAKAAGSSSVEHSNLGHPTSANAPEAAESVATPDSAGRGNSQHAAEPSAAMAAAELTGTDFVPGNGVNNGAEHPGPASDAASASASVKTAESEPAVAEYGNSGHESHSISANAPEAAEIVEPSVAIAQPAKAASEAGGADQETVFRFDSEPTSSALVAVVELKELNDPLDPHVPLGQEEDDGMVVKMVANAPDEHAATHGNSASHHGIVSAHHDLLI